MPSQPRRRSIHVDAPVPAVFEHVKDPNNFVAADPTPVRLSNLSLAPDGSGSTWETSFRSLGRDVHAFWTRHEFIPNQRIVDRVSTGATWAYETSADSGGTTLTLEFSLTTKWSLLNTIIGWVLVSADRQLDTMLHNYKDAIEA